jgi:deoxycytidine triphosphate deaminase
MILSNKEIKNRLIKKEEIKEAREWWTSGEWDKIGKQILIDPLKLENLSVCGYDLSVGEEYISLREPHTPKTLKEEESFTIEPGETVLILTEEFLGFPKNITALVVPRARWIFEGTYLNATRVDPTWYGKLLIGFTNIAKYPITLTRGETFCTCQFIEIQEIEKPLTKKDVYFLGRTKIGKIDFAHARPQELLSPNKVTREDLEKVVKTFGKPWDIVHGSIERIKGEIIQYMERDMVPSLTEEITNVVIREAFKIQQRWHKILIAGLLTGFFTIVGLIFYLILLLK